MEQLELNEILELHKLWLLDDVRGKRAVLNNADLRGANLRGAILRDANLRYTDLRDVDLCGADLRDADLKWADLKWADLRDADLRYADLEGADLNDTDLKDADLIDAKNIPFLPQTIICPEEGSFIGFKKVNKEYIIKLEIPADAKRSNATSRKCRCEFAKVLSITNLDGTDSRLTKVTNYDYAPNITYKINKIVYPDSFDEDRWNECSHGIHFFITRQEAVDF